MVAKEPTFIVRSYFAIKVNRLKRTLQISTSKTAVTYDPTLYFQTNSAIHSVNTRNKNQLHRPIANLSCFQKSAYYAGIKIFNSLPSSLTSLINKKAEFEVALKRYLITHSFYSVDEFLMFTNNS
jgi:predicted peroxiredoxin